MIKSNKIRLLKAVALGTTLGALSTNSSIGTEDNKHEKESNKPAFNAESTGDHTEVAPRVQEILEAVEERRAIRRGLFRQPRTFDLNVMPINDVFNHLYGAYQASDNGAHVVKVETLTLLNITQEQLNQILNHENAGHIEALDWTYQPVLVAMTQDMDNEDTTQEMETETGDIDSGEDLARDRHQAQFVPTLMQIIERKENPGRGLKPVVRQEERGRDRNREQEIRVSAAKQLLEQIDERTRRRQEILSQPRTIDLGVKPIGNVLNVLYNARKYSGQTPIKVKLNLLNVTEAQLNRVLNDENANHIGALDWTYQPVLAAALQDMGHAQFAPVLRQIREQEGQPLNGLHPVFYQEVVAGVDNYRGEQNEENQPMVVVEDRQEGGENIDNVVAEEDGADNGIAEEGDLANLNNHIDEENMDGLAGVIRRAAARRRDAPALPELEEAFEQEDNLEPVNELIVDDGEISKVKPENDVTPIVSALSWNITPINEDTINPILQNLGSSNTQARQASQNLVNIYCRHVPGMVRAN